MRLYRLGIRCDHARREYVQNQAGEIIAWSCNQCPATGKVELKPEPQLRPVWPLPSTVPQLDECDWCGDSLNVSRAAVNAKQRWIFKRFCDEHCYADDLEDRRATGRPITNRDELRRGFELDPERDPNAVKKCLLTT